MELSTLSNVSSNIAASYTKTTNKDGSVTETLDVSSSKSSTSASYFSDEAAVYEKSDAQKDAVYSKKPSDRSLLIKQLQADAEYLKNNLLDIVRKSITGQADTFAMASDDDVWKLIASGKFTVDEAAKKKAQEDIAEDGYWGVDKTSSRIVDFAIGLSGGDVSKADMLLKAFEKGFSEATKTWGKELPDISHRTYDAVHEKFDAWKNGNYPPASTEETA